MGKMLPRNINISFLLIGLVLYCAANTKIVFAEELECYAWDSAISDDPEVKICGDASNNDQCYLRVDVNNGYDIVGMGCVSELGDETAIANLLKNKEVYICATANCNGFENVPNANECTQCDTSSDERCATQPLLAGTRSRCAVVPFTQCYERVNVADGGTTERGCIFELEGDDYYNCLTGSDELCNTCTGSVCNTEVIPANRRQCQRCDSETDSTCASSPSALSACVLYDANDSCVSVYESGVTTRGCASELNCDSSSRNCQICSTDGCNTANVKKLSEELYGIFQDLPLNCNTCSGDECLESTQRLRKCLNNDYQDCLTVFNADGIVVARGCEDNIDAEYQALCEANPDLCYNCKSNGCNTLTEITVTQECLYCDSSVNAECVTNTSAITTTRKCVDGCVTALYEGKTNSNVNELARTCFEDLEYDERETCTDENNCVQCTDGDLCNTAAVPAEGRLSCLHCNGDDCDESTSLPCSAYSESDLCYIFFDSETNSAVRMGCASSEPADAIRNDILHYFICDGDDCNNYSNLPEARFCYVCNSATDVNCAIQPSAITAQVRCQTNPHTDCFTRIDGDGETERGCISTLNNTEFLICHEGSPDEYCNICTESYCNIYVYPSDRQRCHRCNSIDDPNCEITPNAASVCPTFDSDDYCVSKLTDGVVYRGCATELTCDAQSTSKTCRECTGNNCNVHLLEEEYPIGVPGLFQDLPLNCYHCSGEEECSGSLGNVHKCTGNDYQTCTTVFDISDGAVITRGCSDDVVEVCEANSDNCYGCKSNGCNLATTEADYIDCVFCDSQTDERCVTDVAAIRSTRKCYKSCITALYNRTDDASPVQELIRTCLDDKEYDDRNICTAGDDASCNACSTDNCNTDIIGERISCYQCVDDECQDPQAKTCTAVSESDKCFVQYDERGSIVELGCQSKYDADDVKELILAKQLWLCEGDNCNTIDAVPESQVCTICSSVTDDDCAIAPNNVTATTSCANVPYTQCYSRILDSAHTERGCLSSIEGEDFYDCLLGSNASKCLACVGDNCNSEIHPAGRRSCHRCNSLDDPTCESSPSANSICLLYSADDFCTVKIENYITYRGCSTDFQCDVSDKQTCRHCTNADNCNSINLASANIGFPGRWQDLPLSCYTCEDDDCASSSTLRKCLNNNLQNCETIFDSNGVVIRRGCSDDVATTYETYCEENPSNCLGCKSNSCNNATSLDQYIDCYACDSDENSECVFNVTTRTRKCQVGCVIALYPRSDNANPAYELERTCLDDLEYDDRLECLAGENELCKACEGSLCNTGTIPENRHTCYKCTDSDCVDYVVAECSAYQANDQCYIIFDDENSILGLGCRSEFVSDAITALIKQKKFILCDGEACNGPETIPTTKTCTVCDSETDERCATNPNLVSDTASCSAIPYTDCYTRVDENGHTARGCLSNLASETFYDCLTGNDELCETCFGDKCNALDVFPTNRWKCHQCSSDTDSTCASAPNSNTICPIYNATDSCVTNYRDGITTRGCASSLQCDNESDRSTCRICSTDGCNTVNLEIVQSQGEPGRWQDLPITCRTCEGEEDCESLGIYRVCTGNQNQNCLTVFNAEGNVIQRGCSDAITETNSDYCDVNPENCLLCNSNGCNNATQLDDYIDCIYCDTDTNGNCLENIDEVSNRRKCNKYCMTALYPKYEEDNPAYALSRSCLDDMDYDDREACAAGEKENCYACTEDSCNTQSLPETRLSCNVCKEDECQDPQPATCATYRVDDKCYIEFDEQSGVVGMGCRSEYTNAEADNLLQEKRLLLCDGDNCNDYDAIPASQYCTICSSRTDIECATNPTAVTAATSCARIPYTQCYSRVLDSGATERGCLSSLEDDEFASCLNGTAEVCTACSGDYCNQALYPTNRVSCHICDSATDSTCTSKPNSVSVCPLYANNDTCVTAYIDDVTYRSCSSSLACLSSDSRSCVQCEGEACNTINIERKQDDNYGKWQDLPLTCLSCTDDDCNSVETTVSLVCENNNEQDCMTVFQNGTVVRRGCSDAVEGEYTDYCDQDWDQCPNCKSNQCNNATALTEYNECIYCDTNKDLSCLLSPETQKTRLCQGSCMTALYLANDGTDPNYELTRSCLDDKEAADQLTCSSGNEASCASCTGSKCNTVVLPEDRHICYVCEGDDCAEPEVQVCPLYKANDKCFIWFDDTNSIVQMGCVSSFRTQELETLIGTKRIQVCDDVACNSLDDLPTVQTCAVCDSNTDYECATSPLEIGTFSTCSQYPYTSCVTKLISSDGSTTRGCLSDLGTADFVACALGNDQNCSICTGDGCNRKVFPEDRLQCYTCSSEDYSTCESSPTLLQPCPYVTDTETCKTAYGGNITVRGCSSVVFCDVSDRNCRTCSGTGCNVIDLANRAEDDGMHGLWQELPLRCHTCEGVDCLYTLGPAYNCTGYVEQDCVTVFTELGSIKRRGCYDDVEDHEQSYCRENPELCFSCKSNECNDVWDISDYIQCNFCTSETDPSCATNPASDGFAKRACNTDCMVAMKDSHVIRSCLDDKEANVRYVCRYDESGTECASCDTDDCNNFVYPRDRLSCHVCSDASCSTTTAEYCTLYDTNDYCFAKYESGQVELLGCASSQNSSDLAEWQAQNQLHTCTGNNCNALSELPTVGGVCLSCDSSSTPACAQNPTEYTTTESCPPLEHQCVTYLNAAGHTLRGCLSNLSENEQNSCAANGTCAICTGDSCNNEVFPSNRRKCHICNSSTDNDCSVDPNYLQVCPVYWANDRCVTKRESGITHRGCESELQCAANDVSDVCDVCSSDGCNTVELTDGALMGTASLFTTLLMAIVALLGLRFN